MTDAFPSFPSAHVQEVKHPETKKGFRNIADAKKLLISTCYLEDDKVYFAPITPKTDNLMANFYRTGRESFTRFDDYDSVSWEAAANRLKLDRRIQKRNTDVRVSFR